MKLLFPVAGISFALGFLTAWIVGVADPEVNKESVAQVIDTLTIPVYDTVTVEDFTETAPKVVYKSRVVRDTIKDTIYADLQKLKSYSVEKTFEDSAWVRHGFYMDIRDYIVNNLWDYRPAPRMEIRTVDTVEVTPSKAKKILKTVGWVAAGAGVSAVIMNNKD